jgi:integrase
VDDGLIPANPCRIRGAGVTPAAAKHMRPLTQVEVGRLAGELGPPYDLMVLLAAFCSLRYGELAGLHRADVDFGADVLHVRRGIVRTTGGLIPSTPKTRVGIRDAAVPTRMLTMLAGFWNGRHPAARGCSPPRQAGRSPTRRSPGS